MNVTLDVNDRFINFIKNWDYKTYLLVGAYGSSKSYHAALKLILKLLQEKRKALVVREVYDTIKDSCFDLIFEILDKLDLLADSNHGKSDKVYYRTSPMTFYFPNGSKIIFKGMDKPTKLKSLNGVSIAWIEEASEVKYNGIKELFARLRDPYLKIHYILTTNPIKQSWVYKHYFYNLSKDRMILDENVFYKLKTVVKNNVYYHHSLPTDNMFLTQEYIDTLNEMKQYDPYLYNVARWGRFGSVGEKVLPQFRICKENTMKEYITKNKSSLLFFYGMDFGFVTSYNALISIAVDTQNKWLLIYDEYYKNGITDDVLVEELTRYKDVEIIADNAEPKTIKYFNKCGFNMRKCTKYIGSRLENTKKIKRFKKIICSTKCKNTILELKDLTYKVDNKGDMILDQFNIDPHTFSAIWYALDKYDVTDMKKRTFNSWGEYIAK